MIHIYESLCLKHTHEVCNAGFLNLFLNAFPSERIIFYTHETHIQFVKRELNQDSKLKKLNIEFKKISLPNRDGFWSFIIRYFFFLKEKKKWDKKPNDKIIFLSFNRSLLKIFNLIFKKESKTINSLLLVAHGNFEEINEFRFFLNPRDNFVSPESFFIKLISKITSPSILLILVFRKIKESLLKIFYILYLLALPNLKYLLKSFNPNFCRYILLSDHIMKELKNYPELKSLNTSVIPLPVIMRNMNLAPIKKKIIFGVIGYGLPQAFLKLLTLLDRMRISDDYEIRLIGMQPSLTLFKKYSNVVVSIPSTNHNILTRSEIERDIEDVNIQIILYPNNSYQLSQSLSIFEAIRYMKPVLHINNPCINFYNNSKKPIGLMCQSLEDMARTIKKLVEDKNYTFNLLKLFKYNLISVRKEYSIDRSVARLKNIYKNINIK